MRAMTCSRVTPAFTVMMTIPQWLWAKRLVLGQGWMGNASSAYQSQVESEGDVTIAFIGLVSPIMRSPFFEIADVANVGLDGAPDLQVSVRPLF